MARAKRTDRTEARRRYRVEQAGVAGAETETEPEPGKPAATKAVAKPASTPPQQRPSIRSAFGGAMRPLDLRGDLRAAPRVLAHWGVLAAVGIAIASSIVFVVTTNELAQSIDWTAANPGEGKQLSTASNLAYLAVQLFVMPPIPAAGAFLIGFTAKRASWLGGLVFGIVATACYIGILMAPAGQLLTGGNPPEGYIPQAAAIAPVGSALMASIAAWYRRFLNLANPNANNKRQEPRPKKTQGRGDMKPVRR